MTVWRPRLPSSASSISLRNLLFKVFCTPRSKKTETPWFLLTARVETANQICWWPYQTPWRRLGLGSCDATYPFVNCVRTDRHFPPVPRVIGKECGEQLLS
jgi:hypothetical protein